MFTIFLFVDQATSNVIWNPPRDQNWSCFLIGLSEWIFYNIQIVFLFTIQHTLVKYLQMFFFLIKSCFIWMLTEWKRLSSRVTPILRRILWRQTKIVTLKAKGKKYCLRWIVGFKVLQFEKTWVVFFYEKSIRMEFQYLFHKD